MLSASVNRVESGECRRRLGQGGETPAHRQPPEPKPEKDLKQDGQPEGRQTHAQQRDDAGNLICRPVGAYRREDTQRDTDEHRDEHGKEDELERSRPVDAEIFQHRPPGEDGAAPVTLEHTAQVVPVLHREGIVESELAPDLLVHLGGRLRPGGQTSRVAGHDARQRERQQRHPEQGRNNEENAAQDVAGETHSGS
jgi:hypothetical protein